MSFHTDTTKDIKPFMDEDFLLENHTAQVLYHEYAKGQPILDYHCHLPPADMASNRRFNNLTEAWLEGDHYKWRAMRTLGVDEHYITGPAGADEKFTAWAKTVPYTARNPLYHWTHLELRRYFGIDTLLTPATASDIYEQASAHLRSPEGSVQGLLKKMNVQVVCTTDDPVDDLEHHRTLAAQQDGPKVLPAFRPDKAVLIEQSGFTTYLEKLGTAADMTISTLDELLAALEKRADHFARHGCRLSDHGLERIWSVPFTAAGVNSILRKRMDGKDLNQEEIAEYQSALMYYLGCMYHARGWTQQYHLGALRNNSARMMAKLGPDTGFDSIGDFPQAVHLASLLNRLDQEDTLPRTILYNLNPRDNEVIATMIGNFNDGSIRGKMQFGSAWWFLDQKDGMEKQMNALSNMGLLSCFIGMLTDSRSFLSFPRHEYFRRILCNLIGRDVHAGELPNDTEWLGGMVQDICYRNAQNYFSF